MERASLNWLYIVNEKSSCQYVESLRQADPERNHNATSITARLVLGLRMRYG